VEPLAKYGGVISDEKKAGNTGLKLRLSFWVEKNFKSVMLYKLMSSFRDRSALGNLRQLALLPDYILQQHPINHWYVNDCSFYKI